MEKSKKQRYLVGVGAVILLCAVVYAFTLAPKAPGDNPTATSTEQVATTTDIFTMEPIVPEAKVSTDGWKTCRNEEYGWEVKYPGDWYVYSGTWLHKHDEVPLGDCQAGVVELSNEAPGQWVELDDRQSVTIRANQELFGTYRAEYTNVRDLARSLDKLTLKGFYILDGEESVWLESTVTARIDVYHISRRYQFSGTRRDVDLLETILTTFRFLDTASSTASTTPSV